MKQIFNGVTADGSSATFAINQQDFTALILSGLLGGGTVTIEAQSPLDGEWVPMEGLSWSAVGCYPVHLPDGIAVRATLSGSTGANVNAVVV